MEKLRLAGALRLYVAAPGFRPKVAVNSRLFADVLCAVAIPATMTQRSQQEAGA